MFGEPATRSRLHTFQDRKVLLPKREGAEPEKDFLGLILLILHAGLVDLLPQVYYALMG